MSVKYKKDDGTIVDIGAGGGSAEWYGTAAELEEEFDNIPNGTKINITDDDDGSTIVDSNLKADDGLVFKFATDGEGNYGYLGADDSFVPFKSGGELNTFSKEIWIDNLITTTETIGIKGYKKLKGMANANVGTVTLNIYTNGGDILYSEVIYTKGVDTPNVKKDIEIPDDVYLIGDYAKITVVGGEMSTWSTYTVSYEGNN